MRAAVAALAAVVLVLAASSSACLGLPCGLGGRCVPTGEGEGEGEGEGTPARVPCSTVDTQDDPLTGACTFSVASCADGNEYDIFCDTGTSCHCKLSHADGSVTQSDFVIQAQCSEFSTSDAPRFQTFAESNCGFVLDISGGR